MKTAISNVSRSCLKVLLGISLATMFAWPALCAKPEQARADEGTIQINHASGNEGVSYRVYAVFTADIDEQDTASHIAWASDEAKDATIGFLQRNGFDDWLAEQGRDQEGYGDNAQNAAEYIALQIAGSKDLSGGTAVPPTKAAETFAHEFAQALGSSDVEPDTVDAGGEYTSFEGYYLFVSEPDSIGAGQSGTAPIWVALGGSVTSMTEKAALPSASFQVKDDADSANWGSAADAHVGQDLRFRVQGSYPRNIGAYPIYHDAYSITLPAGMELSSGATESVVVEIDGQEATSAATVRLDGSSLTVEVDDMRNAGVEVGPESAVIIEFAAHLGSGSSVGGTGNTLSMQRTYTADPMSLAEKTTASISTVVYAYEMQVVKHDKSNGVALQGAQYSIQVGDTSSDAGSRGLYVQGDGSLASDAFTFTTDAQGVFSVSGIDEGTYVIREINAPSGYQLQDADITVEVSSSFGDPAGLLSDLTAWVSGGEAANVAGDETTRLESVSLQTGLVSVLAVDDRELEMPLTGLQGNYALWLAAAVLAGAGACGLARFRNDERDEDGNRA